MRLKAPFFPLMCWMLLVVSGVGPALGQTNEVSLDEHLRARYEAAAKLMKDGKPSTACPILEDVVTAAPKYAAAKQALADCYVDTGRLLSASRVYETIEKEAADEGQEGVRKAAADKRHALAPRMSHVRIVVPESVKQAKGVILVLDGERLSREEWGVAMPSDRGAHKLEAHVAGQADWRSVFDVRHEGETLEVLVDVHLPYLIPEVSGPQPIQYEEETWSPGRAVGVTLGAVGVAALGFGASFGAIAAAKKNDSDPHCDRENVCDRVGYDIRQDSIWYGNLSTGMLIAGTAMAATGLITFVASPAKRRVSVAIGPNGVVVRGQF